MVMGDKRERKTSNINIIVINILSSKSIVVIIRSSNSSSRRSSVSSGRRRAARRRRGEKNTTNIKQHCKCHTRGKSVDMSIDAILPYTHRTAFTEKRPNPVDLSISTVLLITPDILFFKDVFYIMKVSMSRHCTTVRCCQCAMPL